jgi:S-formylglutathione hydrolase FrmB
VRSCRSPSNANHTFGTGAKKLKLFYIYCGKTDTLFQSISSFNELLDQRKINHKFIQTEEWHVWRNWRDYLADFVPRLFQ